LGYLGPVLRAEVGDTIKVLFKNNARNPYSMHPHGVFYDKNNEGVPNGASGMQMDSMPKNGNIVMPNESWLYTWPVPERAGPARNDPTSIIWMYHSHVEEVRDTNSGLVGAIIVTGAGMADSAGKPRDVTREFVVMFTIVDENLSWYLEDNILTYLKASGINNTELMMDAEFIMSNEKHSVNGLLFSNLKGLSMMQNDTVRWHVIAIGDEVDLHGVHWHGQTLISDGHRVDTMELIPASMKTLDMVPDNVGLWRFHCHTNHHIVGGMSALFEVMPCQGACPRIVSPAATLTATLSLTSFLFMVTFLLL
jgi:FtsP/CotA-like multicopper oxidase with cupredoxin domain